VVRSLRAIALAALIAGCCSGCGAGAARFSGDNPGAAGGGGDLGYAIAAHPAGMDPLHPSSLSEQIVSRQIFEPLVERLPPPYSGSAVSGLALGWRHSSDLRVWSFRLRQGVRFQDGEPFNASAVAANAQRWIADPAGQAALPGLTAADAPRPDLVRLILSRPAPRLPRLLASPRLGIVSPPALSPPNGVGASLNRIRQAGTGPFSLRGRAAGVVVLDRNRRWWGSALGLGPELDQIAFRTVPDPAERVRLLREDAVRVAADLPAADALPLRRDPLVTAIGPASGHALALERSVRGITSWRPQSLSPAWLALVAPGGG
jgi:peptide/nickel transport system substrate-binding protein